MNIDELCDLWSSAQISKVRRSPEQVEMILKFCICCEPGLKNSVQLYFSQQYFIIHKVYEYSFELLRRISKSMIFN